VTNIATAAPAIEITSVAERDVDLLLLRDLADGDWLLRPLLATLHASLPAIHPSLRLTRIAQSVMTHDGESDLELDLGSDDGGRIRLLVENKIGAIFQPQQAERYAARAARFADDHDEHEASTLLVAPAAYAAGELAGFDARVDHEWFLARYRERAESHAGARYGVALLEAAIERGHRGYTKQEDRPTTLFWRAYWETTRDVAPDLRMPPPDISGASNNWIAFRPVARPKNARVLHKLDAGQVHFQFEAAAMPATEVRDRLAALSHHPLAQGVRVVPVGKSTAWERRVPPLDPQRPFESQRDAAITGMRAARDLVALFETSLREYDS
jgi:hypothetical protein